MKLWATLGAVLSVLIGSPPPPGDPAPSPRPEQVVGFVVEDGDFYVWDEDRDEAERWADELARSRRS